MTTTASRKNSIAQVIATEADIKSGLRCLRRRCIVLRRIHDEVGDPPLRRHRAGFEGIARTVVAQQVSAASAAAIWARTEALVRPMTPRRFLSLDDATARACGLSRAKAETLRGLAAAIAEGKLDLTALDSASDEEVRAALMAMHGIGPWTADIYLIFCLGRADAWSSRDLALALAVQQAHGLAARPAVHELDGIAERWRPWRAVAARLLWHYYAAQRRQAGP